MGRGSPTIQLKKLFIIVAEGETEDSYFGVLREIYNATIQPKRIRNQSAANRLLEVAKLETKRFKSKYGKSKDNRNPNLKKKPKYEAWVVVDVDSKSNTNKQLQEIQNWSQLENYYGFALSNPRFELWLLLHFLSHGDASKAVSKKGQAELELQRHFRQYKRNKKITPNGKINDTNIKTAILEAQKFPHKHPPVKNCNNIGQYISAGNFTTVFRLVENIVATGT